MQTPLTKVSPGLQVTCWHFPLTRLRPAEHLLHLDDEHSMQLPKAAHFSRPNNRVTSADTTAALAAEMMVEVSVRGLVSVVES